MSKPLKLAAEFNRYFTSSNGVDVPERVSVSRDEWRQLHAALQAERPDASPWTENVAVKLAPSRTGRAYIAGPMTGIAEFNFPAFNKEAVRLRAEGLTVLNPADHGIVEGAEWMTKQLAWKFIKEIYNRRKIRNEKSICSNQD